METRSCGIRLVHAVVSARPGATHPGSSIVRRLGQQPVWPAAVSHLLQNLHRKGLGNGLQRNLSRLGSTANPGPVALVRYQERTMARAPHGAAAASHQDAHRFVPLPTTWPRHDVGSVCLPRQTNGRRYQDGSTREGMFVGWLNGSMESPMHGGEWPAKRNCRRSRHLFGAIAPACGIAAAGFAGRRHSRGRVAEVSRLPHRGPDR